MEELTRMRAERGWSQQRLANASGVNKATINQIERGRRSPKVETLEKLAAALRAEVADLFPKAQAPLPNLFDGQRRSVPTDAVFGLLERWHARRMAEVDDPSSPHFRDASAAALWIADARNEAQDFCEALAEVIASLPKTPEGLNETLRLFGFGLALDSPAELGEMRLQEMADKPDDLAARRLKRATAEAQASMKRLQELGKAANG
jgi:transcriptional regulator with XRE-family HTH domain